MASWHCNNFASFHLFSDRIKFSERAGWGRCCAWRGSWSEHFWHFLRGRNIAKSAAWVVLFFIYPGMKKKTKINAHELEALRFLLTCYELTENTTIGAGQGGQGRAGGRAEQGAGQGARSAAAAGCVPAPTRPASINSWQFGARTSAAARTCRFLAADSHSIAADRSSVCVCARARKHVGTNFIPALTHTVIICVCVCVCVCVCMYVCMYVCM